jgi:hypothetical protein
MARVKHVRISPKDKSIDRAVIDQASDDSLWGKETNVSPTLLPTSIRLSSRTIERAKFFSRIHHERGYQTWLKKVIEDRVNTEYELYRRLKEEVVA